MPPLQLKTLYELLKEKLSLRYVFVDITDNRKYKIWEFNTDENQMEVNYGSGPIQQVKMFPHLEDVAIPPEILTQDEFRVLSRKINKT